MLQNTAFKRRCLDVLITFKIVVETSF